MSNIFALVGNPNSGKSTFFNSITGADEHVGNWHGVTTEIKEKKLKNTDFVLTDLPGTYSLSPYSYEEAVTRDYLLSHKNAKVINIVDGNNLERNLLLTFELIEMGCCPIVCINMAKELKKSGAKIDTQKLENMLGIKVFLINAQSKKETKQVVDYVIKHDTKSQHLSPKYIDSILQYFEKLTRDIIKKDLTTFEKIKVLEQDEFVLDTLNLEDEKRKKLEAVLNNAETLEYVIKLRYSFISEILSKCLFRKKDIYGFHRFDKVALNRWLAFPIFIIIMSLIFFLTFGDFGATLSNTLSNLTERFLLSPFINFVRHHVSNDFVLDFVSNALCASILSLVSFLPQVVLMFLGLYVLEDSGYMSRIAFTFEDFLKRVGLSGKSVFALLMSFGCSTTATLSSRNLEQKNSKIKTAMLTPYISCSAKLPIYAVICGAFFPRHKFLIVLSLYFLGIVVSLCVSYFLNKTILPSESTSFVMEMPKYRFPSLKKLSKNILYSTKQFLLRVGSVLLGFSCIVWILQNCNFKFQYQVGESMLESISKLLAPIFSLLGFGSSGAVSVLLCGFVAKEIIVSTIGIINGISGTGSLLDISASIMVSTSAFCLTQSSSLSFLVFSLLYVPCISTVSVMTKEIGKKWTLFACLIQFVVSYTLSFAVYTISKYFLLNGVFSGIISLFVFVIICIFVLASVHLISKKKTCKYCPNNKYCNKIDK